MNPERSAERHNSWILAETWRLVDERVSARREPRWDHRRLRWMGWAIRVVLKEDR